jgi:2-polyprenyl-6-methoxyphenol hydroxylase-like FAD-dependent oxidoreductase
VKNITYVLFDIDSDSAHRIHPMAGQGVNMGFSDVQCLVNTLERAVTDGADFSRKYNSHVRLHRLFSSII